MKLSDAAKKVLGAVAPLIGTALGGPLGGAAGAALAKGLGLSATDEREIEAAIVGASPEVLAQLRKADNDFEVQMKALDIDLERIHAGDRASARDLAKIDMGAQKWISSLMLGVIVACLATYVWLLIRGGETMNRELIAGLGIVVGALVREIGTIMQFWFGSSSGSKDKTAVLSK